MPERDRQLARVLNLTLSIAAAVTFAVVAPTANAAPIDSPRQNQPSSTPTSPTSPKGTGTSTSRGSSNSNSKPTSSTPPPRPDCPGSNVPPPADEGDGDPMAPLEVPEQPVGGTRMGECLAVVPNNAPLPPDKLTASSWVIADLDTGDVLAAYAPHARQRPAGTAKILLAMVALREIPADKVIVGTKEDTSSKLKGSKVGIVADGKYTAKDLIRALIVHPAVDAASALARELGGPDEAVRKMNALAEQLQALDTRVINPFGNDAPGMSTSAFDTALIYQEAMRLPEFAEATGAKSVAIKPQGSRNNIEARRSNDNQLLASFKGATGGKQGSTEAAKNTYVGSARRDGRNIVVSIMRSDKAPFEQAAALLNYGFTLASNKVQPVGTLGKVSEPAKTSRDTPLQNPEDEDDNTAFGPATLQRSAFGNFGLPITILAGVVVLLGLLLTMRRKMQRARRLRTQPR
ncbi:MAG: serine hydrolase [Kibdelosporangium sp.]